MKRDKMGKVYGRPVGVNCDGT